MDRRKKKKEMRKGKTVRQKKFITQEFREKPFSCPLSKMTSNAEKKDP